MGLNLLWLLFPYCPKLLPNLRAKGFTLLEIVVAMAIFVGAATTIMAHAGLLADQQTRANRHLAETFALQSALVITQLEASRPAEAFEGLELGGVFITREIIQVLDTPGVTTGARGVQWQQVRLTAPSGRAVSLWARRP